MSTVSKQVSRKQLADKIRSYAPDADLAPIEKACDYVARIISSQQSPPEPGKVEQYLQVALILADMKVDVTTIVAGLLYDLAEDGTAGIEEIRSLFGEDVGFLVSNTTKVARMEFREEAQAQVESFRKMLLAMSKDIRVIMIRFAAHLNLMRVLETLPSSERVRIAREVLDIYAPLANRLGIGWLKIQFEDLAFKHLLPEEYRDLEKKVAKRKKDQQSYVNEVIEIIKDRLDKQHINCRIFGRVKHYYGIYQKTSSQSIPFEKVCDVVGIRIITRTQGECYAVLGIIHGMYTPVPGRLKDFIGAPKSNGYQSLQTTVIGPRGERVEFQIRTEDMDQVAEHGIAAHWRYKDKEPLSKKDQAIFSSLREMIQGYQNLQDSRDFLNSVKGDLFSHVVYVFTPEGDLKELPTGSCPIDFAYRVHSEVGNQCVGARVNGKIVPLRYKLQHGDTVEILTHPGHGPSRDWLKIAKSSKALNRIRAWLKVDERNRSLELGSGLLERELRKNNLSPKLAKSDKVKEIASQFSFQSIDELLVAIGYGKYSARQVVNRLLPASLTPSEKAFPGQHEKAKVRPPDIKGVRITGLDHLLYHFSKCCYPLPGDEIAGFVTRGRGVAVHTRDCPNLNLMTVDRDRLIDVNWEPVEDQSHPVNIRISAKDKQGMLASLSSVLSSAKVNINRLDSGSGRDGTAYFNFLLEVKSKKHLENVLKKLNEVPGVIRVQRTKTI